MTSLAQKCLTRNRTYKELWLLPTKKYEVLQDLRHCLLNHCKIPSRWIAFKKDLQVLSPSAYHLSPSVYCKFNEAAPLSCSLTQNLQTSSNMIQETVALVLMLWCWTLKLKRNKLQEMTHKPESKIQFSYRPTCIFWAWSHKCDVWVCNLHSKNTT